MYDVSKIYKDNALASLPVIRLGTAVCSIRTGSIDSSCDDDLKKGYHQLFRMARGWVLNKQVEIKPAIT